MRLICVIPSLRAGGSERVLTGLVAGLAQQGVVASIVCLQPADEAPFYPLPEATRLLRLDALSDRGSVAWWCAVTRLRRVLRRERADAILAFTTVGGILAALAQGYRHSPLILAERTDPAAHGARIGWLARSLRNWSYRRASHVVVQSAAAQRHLAGLGVSRVSVIGNPVPLPASTATPDRPTAEGRYHVIAAGRLVPDKGFDRLLAAFATLVERFPDWDLVIHGEGPLRAALTRQATELGLARRVRLPGVTPDLGRAMASAHLFVLPSRLEGFANVLGEALAAGLPAIAYRGIGGVDLLIRPDATGLLANAGDAVNSLAEQMARTMADAALRTRLGSAARQHVAGMTQAVHSLAWQDLLSRVVASTPPQTGGADFGGLNRHRAWNKNGIVHVRDHRIVAPRRELANGRDQHGALNHDGNADGRYAGCPRTR